MARNSYTYDSKLQIKDAGLIAASAICQVGGSNQSIDLGPAHFDGALIINVSAIEIASNDELYTIILEGSNASGFDSGGVVLAMLPLGALEVLPGGGTMGDSTVGRYVLPFHNEQAGTVYRYVRGYTLVAGTVATGINYEAFLGRDL